MAGSPRLTTAPVFKRHDFQKGEDLINGELSALHRTQARVVRLLYSLVNAGLAITRRCMWPRSRPRSARNVCIYRIGNIGDILCALPAMMAVRQTYPEARLTLLTSPGKSSLPGARELLEGAPWLDELLLYLNVDIATFHGRLVLLKELRQRSFDVWIELPNDIATLRVTLRNMLLAWLAGARWAYGWRLNTIDLFVQAQSEYSDFPNETERLLKIVGEAGISTGQPQFPLPLGVPHRQTIDRLLKEHGLGEASLAAIAPGARRPANRWPVERFGQVGNYLVRKGLKVVVLGGSNDAEACRTLANVIGPDAVNLAGQTTVLETCELLKRCRLAICNDSGAQHMAAAVGTPCVSLFSYRDMRGKWWPHGSANTVLQKWVPCHTCFLDVCPYDNHCLSLIPVSEVTERVDQKLGDKVLVS
ncbi:MAG: glycosyltransferase family 9 protein [Terriglobia bacterium]